MNSWSLVLSLFFACMRFGFHTDNLCGLLEHAFTPVYVWQDNSHLMGSLPFLLMLNRKTFLDPFVSLLVTSC